MRAYALILLLTLMGIASCGGGGGQADEPVPPQGQLSPSSLTFGRIAVGQTSGPRTAVLTNIGGQPLIISRFEYEAGIEHFQVQHNCPESLPPGASCTGTFVCAPVGTISGNVTVYVYHNGRFPQNIGGRLQTLSALILTCFT